VDIRRVAGGGTVLDQEIAAAIARAEQVNDPVSGTATTVPKPCDCPVHVAAANCDGRAPAVAVRRPTVLICRRRAIHSTWHTLQGVEG